MANMAIGGARWIKGRDGVKTPPIEERTVASAYNTGIFRGDPVKLVSDGTIAAAAAGDAIYGFADGAVRYKGSDGVVKAGNFVPASTTYNGSAVISNPEASIVKVIPARGQVFEMDCNTSAATLAAAQTLMFNNVDVAAGAGGSTTSGRSTYVLDNSSTGTATAQCRLLEISPQPSTFNDVTAANWKCLFEVNEGTEPLYTATGT